MRTKVVSVIKKSKQKFGTQEERAKAIQEVIKTWAYDDGDYWFISFWELADNLNNWWFAPLFVSEKFKGKEYTETDKNWSVPSYHRWEFIRMVNWTVKRMKGAKIIQQRYQKYFYRIPKGKSSKEAQA